MREPVGTGTGQDTQAPAAATAEAATAPGKAAPPHDGALELSRFNVAYAPDAIAAYSLSCQLSAAPFAIQVRIRAMSSAESGVVGGIRAPQGGISATFR